MTKLDKLKKSCAYYLLLSLCCTAPALADVTVVNKSKDLGIHCSSYINGVPKHYSVGPEESFTVPIPSPGKCKGASHLVPHITNCEISCGENHSKVTQHLKSDDTGKTYHFMPLIPAIQARFEEAN